MQPKRPFLADGFFGHFHRRGKIPKTKRQYQPRQRIPRQDNLVRGEGRHAALLQSLRQPAARQRAAGGGKRTDQVVPGKNIRAPLVRDELRQPGLLDGQEWPNFVPAGADDADNGRQGQQDGVAGEQEGRPG